MTDSRSEAVAHFAGGRLGPSDWTTLAGVAADHRGDLELVPRSGVRVRRADGAAVSSSELVAAGLPQRVGDERLPHVIASPMAGRLAGHRDLADLPERLGTELLRRAESALRGVLLVGFDDGSGDVLAHSPDLAVVAGEAGAAVADAQADAARPRVAHALDLDAAAVVQFELDDIALDAAARGG